MNVAGYVNGLATAHTPASDECASVASVHWEKDREIHHKGTKSTKIPKEISGIDVCFSKILCDLCAFVVNFVLADTNAGVSSQTCHPVVRTDRFLHVTLAPPNDHLVVT